jgi:hypothetical protein
MKPNSAGIFSLGLKWRPSHAISLTCRRFAQADRSPVEYPVNWCYYRTS